MSDIGFNPYVVLISGKSGTGKSSSLEGLTNHEKVLYLNCENGRALPFKSGFKEVTITHPEQVITYLTKAKSNDKYDTIIIDSLTYLMDMYETKIIVPSADTRKTWGEYFQFFKRLMDVTAGCNKQIIFTAHTDNEYNEAIQINEVFIKVKGALKNRGIESYFSVNVSPKKESTIKLEDYQSDLLTITEDEEDLGFKHVIQTRVTKDTVNERIKTPKNMFSRNETFIDGNIQLILDRLKVYYDKS